MIVIVFYIYVYDSLVLRYAPGNFFVRFAVLRFIKESFIAFDANSACLEVFKMFTVIVL